MPALAPVLGNIALNLAVAVGASLLENLFRPKKPDTTPVTTSRGISFELTLGESVPVSAVFGEARATPHLVFAQEYAANNEFLAGVFKCGRGHYEAATAFLVDEKVRALSGSNTDPNGFVVDDFRLDANGAPSPGGTPHMWVKFFYGAPGQAADAQLVTDMTASARWGSTSRLTGCPGYILRIRQHPVFGSTLPRTGAVFRGLRLYDWRFDDEAPGGEGDQREDDPSTWTWSENPYVGKWNYRRGIYINGVRLLGMGFSRRAQDLAYYTAAANLSDELIDYPDTVTTLPRYAFGREIFDDEDHQSVLAEFDAAGCGTSFDRGGADAPLPAKQESAVMTLTDLHLMDRTAARLSRKGRVSETFTSYRGQIVDRREGWQARPYGARSSPELAELIGGARVKPFDQPFESHFERGQGRAEIMLRRGLYRATRTEVFGPRTNILEPGDCISRVMGDWGTMLGLVEEVAPLPGRAGNRITWRQWHNGIVPASGESFVDLPVGPGPGPAAADRTIAVSGLNVTAYGREGGGAIHAYLKASWTHIGDPNVTDVKIVVWPTAGSEAADGETFFADPRLSDVKLLGPLTGLTEYTGYAIPIRRDDRHCVPTNPFVVTTGAEVAPLVADDAITPAMLAQELKNITGPLVRDIYNRFASYDEQLGDLAIVIADNASVTRQVISGISARNASVAAAVLRVEKVAITATEAIAELTEDVAAVMGNLYADGMLKITASVDAMTATTTINLLVKASDGTFTANAALQLGATINAGVPDSWINMMADRLRFISTAGAYVSQPFAITGGFAYITELRFQHMLSMDGAVVEIEGRNSGGYTPFIRVG